MKLFASLLTATLGVKDLRRGLNKSLLDKWQKMKTKTRCLIFSAEKSISYIYNKKVIKKNLYQKTY